MDQICDFGREGDGQGDDFGEADAGDDADDAAGKRHGGRFDEELQQDVVTAGAERLAHADFARPLGDGDEHDVHDDDAADDERNAGDGHDHDAEVIQDVAQQILEGGAGVDGERIGLHWVRGGGGCA